MEKKIGATHEKYVKKYDTNVQVQGLPGRMTGYWKDIIESGHKTGPYRTSGDCIKEYHETYENPFGFFKYSSKDFNLRKGRVTSRNPTFLSPENIDNLDKSPLPIILDPSVGQEGGFNTFDELKTIMFVKYQRKINGPHDEKTREGACHLNSNGFWISTRYCRPSPWKGKCEYDQHIVITQEMFDKASSTKNLNELGKVNDYVVIPVYKNDNVLWYCRFKK